MLVGVCHFSSCSTYLIFARGKKKIIIKKGQEDCRRDKKDHKKRR